MDAAGWDERYDTAEFVWATEPNRFLPGEVEGLVPGRALDVACGEGRNAVWLATQGWSATGIDFSAVGLAKAAQLAEHAGVTCDWMVADVAESRPAGAPAGPQFDLVVLFYAQMEAEGRRNMLASSALALAPGGTLLWVAHDLTNLADGVGGPQDASVLSGPDDVIADLLAAVPDLVVERAEVVRRPVERDGRTVDALDTLVRVRRHD
ncbi:MAG: class I SAM-dependent methyltransferase [Microthrixaceae bacterium]